MLISMLAKVYVLLLTRFTYLINALSFNFYVCYQMIHGTEVILSICIAVVDYTCIKSVREFRKFIRLK